MRCGWYLAVAVLALSGCGRIWFDATGLAGGDGSDGGLPGNDATGVPLTILIEAEDFVAATNPGGNSWVFMTDVPGYSGAGFMLATPDSATCLAAPAGCPSMSYEYTIPLDQQYNFFIRVYAEDADASTLFFGDEDDVDEELTATQLDAWHWVIYNGVFLLGAGGHHAAVWMQDGGLRFDALAITTLATPPAI
ncbi:MAG: hypothetical protein AB7P03_26015 [Kofleriaceae bacterium]